jgi:hypothetical protein
MWTQSECVAFARAQGLTPLCCIENHLHLGMYGSFPGVLALPLRHQQPWSGALPAPGRAAADSDTMIDVHIFREAAKESPMAQRRSRQEVLGIAQGSGDCGGIDNRLHSIFVRCTLTSQEISSR